MSPVQRDTPQMVPFSWPERLPIPAAVSNVSQKARVPPSCIPQAVGDGVGTDVEVGVGVGEGIGMLLAVVDDGADPESWQPGKSSTKGKSAIVEARARARRSEKTKTELKFLLRTNHNLSQFSIAKQPTPLASR